MYFASEHDSLVLYHTITSIHVDFTFNMTTKHHTGVTNFSFSFQHYKPGHFYILEFIGHTHNNRQCIQNHWNDTNIILQTCARSIIGTSEGVQDGGAFEHPEKNEAKLFPFFSRIFFFWAACFIPPRHGFGFFPFLFV